MSNATWLLAKASGRLPLLLPLSGVAWGTLDRAGPAESAKKRLAACAPMIAVIAMIARAGRCNADSDSEVAAAERLLGGVTAMAIYRQLPTDATTVRGVSAASAVGAAGAVRLFQGRLEDAEPLLTHALGWLRALLGAAGDPTEAPDGGADHSNPAEGGDARGNAEEGEHNCHCNPLLARATVNMVRGCPGPRAQSLPL